MTYKVYKDCSRCCKCVKYNHSVNNYKCSKTYNSKINNSNKITTCNINYSTLNNTNTKYNNSMACKTSNSLSNTKKYTSNYPIKTCNCSKCMKNKSYKANCYNKSTNKCYNNNYPVNNYNCNCNCNRRRYGLWYLLFFAFLL